MVRLRYLGNRALLLAVALGLGGCFFDRGGLSAPDVHSTTDQDSADTRLDGPGVEVAPDGDAQTPDVDATPGDTAPGDFQPVDSDATPADTQPPDTQAPDGPPPPCAGLSCPLGCNTTVNRCYRVKPSNTAGAVASELVWSQLTAPVTLSATTATINPSTGEIMDGTVPVRQAGLEGVTDNGIYWAVVSQGGGAPEIGVFAMTSFVVSSGTTLEVQGSHALALYVTTDVKIEGTLTAPVNANKAGAGGFDGGAAGGNTAPVCFGGEGHGGGNDSNYEGGGGGGGRKGNGGNGGDAVDASPDVDGGDGGTSNGADTLVPLYGGCGGGGGGDSNGGDGGGGGGAIQISANGLITVGGTITVPGAGGRGATAAGGGGGGSGGAILLEGLSVSVTGIIAANGGGGGAGTTSSSFGEDGTASTSIAAQGGSATNNWASDGGDGGRRSSESGKNAQNVSHNAGGGGGGAGRLRVNAPTIKMNNSNATPAPSNNTTTIDIW